MFRLFRLRVIAQPHICADADILSHLVRKADIKPKPAAFTISSVHRLIAALAPHAGHLSDPAVIGGLHRF
jgi:hypothetical protein